MQMPTLLPEPAGVKNLEEVLLYNPDYSVTEHLRVRNQPVPGATPGTGNIVLSEDMACAHGVNMLVGCQTMN